MNSQDILNIALAVVVFIIGGCAVVITYYFIRTLKSVTSLTDSVEDTLKNIKSRLQLKALYLIPSLLVALMNRIFKRGR